MKNSLPKTGTSRPIKPATVIGWREMVALPDIGLPPFAAKIDTGARTSALHASRIRCFDKDGVEWVEFLPAPIKGFKPGLCQLPIKEHRHIKNTSGIPEERIVVRTRLSLAGKAWAIDISLADRGSMAHALILGRTAIRKHALLVDCGRSFLTGGRKTLAVKSESN